MAGRLDHYVAKQAWAAYAATLVFFVLLLILLDQILFAFDYLDALSSEEVGFVGFVVALAGHYAAMTPVLFVGISPYVSVVAGMFAVSRMMGANEVAPMLFTGRSIFRVLRPVLGMGIVSALATAACWEFVVPNVSSALGGGSAIVSGPGESATVVEGLVLKPSDRTRRVTLFCFKYDHGARRMESLTLIDRSDGALPVVTVARYADWNPEAELWELTGGERRHVDRITPLDRLELPEVTPDLLWRTGKEGRETMALSYSELLDLRELRPGRRDLVLAFHSHLTFPLANLVLLLLVLPFAVRFERGTKMSRVVLAIAICAAYFGLDLTCQSLGKWFLHPVLAAWLPTIVFGSFGVALFGSTRT